MLKLFKNLNIKKYLPVFLGIFILILFLFSPFPALAIPAVVNVLIAIPAMILNVLLIFLIHVSYAFAWLMGVILDLVISPEFISLSYTNPANNEVIESGLNITQSFVNLFLVLVLVYTAFSIALRLNENEAKKMLVRLIVVALLVNFAPVFLGLIVDAANITMNYFLRPIEAGGSGVLLQMDAKRVINMIIGAGFRGHEQLGILMASVSQITLNIGVGIAFFLFAGIFLIRYIAIWVLVILAPLAFVAWIFPSGKIREFWNMWFNQFIQWSIIGIPIAFFLYLSLSTFSLMTQAFYQDITAPGIDAPTIGFLNESFPFFVILVFLFAGFTVGLQTGAMGGQAVIGLTKKAGVWGAKNIGKFTQKGAIGLMGPKTKERTGQWATSPGALSGFKEKSFWSKVGAVAGTASGFWAIRRGLGKAGLKLTEESIKDVKKSEEKYKGTIPQRKKVGINDALRTGNNRKAVGILNQAIEEGQINDLKLEEKDIIKIGEKALKTDPEQFKKIRDAYPDLAEKMIKDLPKELKEKSGISSLTQEEIDSGITIPMKIMAKIKPDFIAKMDEKYLKNCEEYFHSKLANANQVAALLEKGPAKIRDRFIIEAEKNGIDHYKKFNPGVANYLESNPGVRALGKPLSYKDKIEISGEFTDINKYKK